MTLSNLFAKIDEKEIPEGWDFEKKIICIYGLGLYLLKMKEISNFKGLLIPSTIYLDKEKIPLFDFSTPITEYGLDSDYASHEGSNILKKNIYSFGIISVIILSEKQNSFIEDNKEKERIIKKEIMPKIKELTSQRFIKLLKICISEREITRPEPELIINEIEKLINEKGSISEELIKKLKNNIEISTNTINKIITLEKNINNLDSTKEPQKTGEKAININSKIKDEEISENNIPDKKEEKQIENEAKNDINDNNIEKKMMNKK